MNQTLKKLSEETRAKISELLLSKEWQDFVTKTKEATDTGSFEVVISTADVDRAGETIDQNGWELDNYLKNPVVLWGHDYWSLPIGITDEIKVEGGNLIAKGRFAPADANPFAQQVRKLYDLKIVRTTSVGFIAREVDGQLIKKAELLEFSFVPVPANPYALSLREIKEFSLDTDMLTLKGIVILPKAEGDPCTTDDDKEGTMKPDADGNLICMPTEKKAEGDVCTMDDGTEGAMKPDADGNLVCMVKQAKAEGDVCSLEDGTEGVMKPDADGNLVCMPKPEEKAEGDSCTTDDGKDGVMNAEGVCIPKPEEEKKDAEKIGAALSAMQSIIDNAIVEASKQILELYGGEESNKAIKLEKPAAVIKEGGAGEEHLGGDALKQKSKDAGVKEVIEEFETFLMTRQLLRSVVTAATDSLERMNEMVREKRIGHK